MDSVLQIRRMIRLYRAAQWMGGARADYQKTKDFLRRYNHQNDKIFNAVAVVDRIKNKEVQPSDVRKLGKAALNHSPHVYYAVLKHIRNRK